MDETRLTRREVLRALGILTLAPGCAWLGWERSSQAPAAPETGVLLNDVHSRLNPSRVGRVAEVRSLEDLRTALAGDTPISIAGGRHSMGGQQFGEGTLHLDTRPMRKVLAFDVRTGIVEVEAGIQWPDLIRWYLEKQGDVPGAWGIGQKQTGADRLTVGGALAANAHGRGLAYQPIVGDVAFLTVLDAGGRLLRCSRRENPELFSLVIGGYGLFGIVYSVGLILRRRRKLVRVVEVREAQGLADAFAGRIREGYLYGDFQFETNEASPTFLRRGVFACYRPVADATPIASGQAELSGEEWVRLLRLAHTDKARVFDLYAGHYLRTNGQIYWTDTNQLSYYPDGYHRGIDEQIGARAPGSEMITEVYVPRDRLEDFLAAAADGLRAGGADVIYGTVRLIERDDVTRLAWAREPYACLVFNLHVTHDAEGIASAQRNFRLLIDLARARGGSYFLTYHRWATREQVLDCYPQLPEVLRLKRELDPGERFQSDWYRHHRALLA